MDDELEAVLQRAGLSWSRIEATASEAVLFGSRAAGVATVSSDWDLLLVGEGAPVHSAEIDLLWTDEASLRSDAWLGSELANHVAVYGRWLFGPGDWRHHVRPSRDAAASKETALELQLTELLRNWASLLPAARSKHACRLRRDAQRLDALQHGVAVAPTPLLDAAWAAGGPIRHTVRTLLNGIGGPQADIVCDALT